MLEIIATIAILVFLETALSIDNALVLAVIARSVPENQQKKVLTYGLIGAILFRMVAIGFASVLVQYTWLKVVGGAYLLFLAVQFFWSKHKTKEEEVKEAKMRGFWMTVLIVELTDIAFAIDSILAAVAMSSVYWIIVTAGIIGTFTMRFAASHMIHLLNKHPNLESSAFILISIIGAKVLIEAAKIPGVSFHDMSSPVAYIPWALMAAALAYGFFKPKQE